VFKLLKKFLTEKCLKMCIFWKKVVKSIAAKPSLPPTAGGPAPRSPTLQLLPVVAALYPFIVLYAFSYYRKTNATTAD